MHFTASQECSAAEKATRYHAATASTKLPPMLRGCSCVRAPSFSSISTAQLEMTRTRATEIHFPYSATSCGRSASSILCSGSLKCSVYLVARVRAETSHVEGLDMFVHLSCSPPYPPPWQHSFHHVLRYCSGSVTGSLRCRSASARLSSMGTMRR
jgi:hypothetical protein